jgi:hypothetical protein
MHSFLVGAFLMVAPAPAPRVPAKAATIDTRVQAVRALATQALDLVRPDAQSQPLSLADELFRASR